VNQSIAPFLAAGRKIAEGVSKALGRDLPHDIDEVGEAVPAPLEDPPTVARVDRLLSAAGLDEGLLDRPLATLSTGERLRLALVRALIDEPRVLLLDEPTAALDVAASALVEELIRFQLLAGRTVLIASHDKALVGRLAHARLQLAKSDEPVSRERIAP
jgi:ATPase subunit of ABC transporter with duplicated ATPase domains